MQVMRHCSPSAGGQRKWIRSNVGYRIDRPCKDEDLALFHDMHTQENKNFLHPSTDDIEAPVSTKLGGLTGFRNFALQTCPWKGNDLLAMDSEKNDYDWLLTPPGTPLFPSLDKDSAQTYKDRGVLMQPCSVSTVSRFLAPNTTEQHNRISRRSPGPRTPPSVVSSMNSSNTFSRSRASSPSRVHCSPTLRPATPTKTLARSTTMLTRASASSSPPILRRTNTSPSVHSSSSERNVSSKGRSRAASLSPKLQAWQVPELGFSTETPPNLRTSLDRPKSSSRSERMRSRPGTHVEVRHSFSEAVHGSPSYTVDSRQSSMHNSSSSASKVSSSTTSQDRWSSRGSVLSSSDDGTDVMEPTYPHFGATSPSSASRTSKTLTQRFDNEVSSKWEKILPPEPAKSKFEVNANDAIYEDYNKANNHAAQYDQESITESASCVMDVTIAREVDTTMYIDTHEACMEQRNQANCDAAFLRVGKSSLQPMALIKGIEHDSIDEDGVGIPIPHTHTNQIFVDIQEDTSMQQQGTPWLYHDLANPHQCNDKPEFSNNGASPNSREPFKPEQEARHEATWQARKETNVRSPQRTSSMQVYLNPKQSPHGRKLGMEQPVIESITKEIAIESITNASMSAAMSHQDEASLHPPKLVDLPLLVKPASVIDNEDFPDRRRQLQALDLLKRPLQKSKDSAVMAGRPDVMEKAFLCSNNITEGLSRLGPSEMEENFPSCLPQAFPQQPELPSQASCCEYHIDMPEIQENVNTREESKLSALMTARKLSYVENESSFNLVGIYDVDYSGVHSKSDAVNLNEVGEQFKQVLSLSDASFPMAEHNSSHSTVLTNGLPLSLQELNRHIDVIMISSVDLNHSADMDGANLSESCVAIEASAAEVSAKVYHLDQVELSESHGKELSKPLVSSEYCTQSSNEAQTLCSSTLRFEKIDPQETVLFGNKSQVLGTEDTSAHTNAVLITEGQYHSHSTETPIATHTSPRWKPTTPSFSLEETTNMILFCSSIVHDMVYKAASKATEKEAVEIASAAPLSYQGKRSQSTKDFMSSLRGKVSKSGARKGRKKEGKSCEKRPQGKHVTKVPIITITQHPAPINGMEKSPASMEVEKALPDDAERKSCMGLSVNSNCQCSIM